MSRDYHPFCCPRLRFAAEAERLLELGVDFGARFSISHNTEALVIAGLRERFGCPGPSAARGCPWACYGAAPQPSEDVPVVGRRRDDGRAVPGEFL